MKRSLTAVVILSASLVASSASAQSIFPTLQRLRADYPALLMPDQAAALLNRVAWEHRSDGWGLYRKEGGNRCPAPQGVPVSCDILVHRGSGHHFDVLLAGPDGEPCCTPGPSQPAWQDAGPADLSRFVEPVAPNPNQPLPPTNGPPVLKARLIEVQQSVLELQSRVDLLSARLEQLVQHLEAVDTHNTELIRADIREVRGKVSGFLDTVLKYAPAILSGLGIAGITLK